MALTDDLIAYWKLDEASGNAIDAHTNNIDLTDTNGVGTDASGKINSARDFEQSSSQTLTVGDSPELSAGAIDFSIQAWIKAETLTSFPVVVGKGVSGFAEYVIFWDDTGYFSFRVSNGVSQQVTVNSTATVTTGTWYHLIAWHENGVGVGLTVDDQATPDTAVYVHGSFDSVGSFYIGAAPLLAGYWDGLIDEVGFWKRKLSSAEITQLYAGGSGLAYPFGGGGGGTLMGQILT